MTTRSAYKLRLALAIALFAMPAHVAGAAGVAWINRDDRHTGQDRLVGQECAKLEKTPTVVPCPLSLSNRYPVAYAVQVFESDGASGVFGFLDKGLADNMVHVGTESLLLSSDPAKMPLGRWSSYRLKNGAARGVPLALLLDERSVEGVPVARGRYFDEAQVDPQDIVHEPPVVLWHIARRQRTYRACRRDRFLRVGQGASWRADLLRCRGCAPVRSMSRSIPLPCR